MQSDKVWNGTSANRANQCVRVCACVCVISLLSLRKKPAKRVILLHGTFLNDHSVQLNENTKVVCEQLSPSRGVRVSIGPQLQDLGSSRKPTTCSMTLQ